MRKAATWCGALLVLTTAACEDDPNNPTIGSGLPAPMTGVYDDFGPAPEGDGFRALMGFPTRDVAGLDAAIDAMYDPASPELRNYMTADAWIAAHAPAAGDIEVVRGWLSEHGMKVTRVASNRLLLEFTGTVGQFNEAFETVLHKFERENPSAGGPPVPVYGTTQPLKAPPEVAAVVTGVITADMPADTKELPGEAGDIVIDPPPGVTDGKTPNQISHAYELDALYQQGCRGQGVKLGVVVGATFKFKDLQSFWQTFGVTRADPITVEIMEPVATRYLETTLDVQWSGAMAPEAELIAYEGPDARNTSIVYAFNEAIARDEVSVLSSSFAHREETEADAVRNQFNDSARMGAALGMTIVVASGDSSRTDIPSSSPYVTCVGGTELRLDASGNVADELAWSGSGSGAARSFPLPSYQQGVVTDSDGKRAVADVALNASTESPYWVYYLAEWNRYGGTSFAAPVFAGLVAAVNSCRAQDGAPPVGFLNPLLYRSTDVQETFRDVVEGETPYYKAGPGWDYPTGWGAPSAIGLSQTLP
ncbi:MAG: S8 family serine peptidase [Polyangiaceae bacterium]|nr:S8 family serine peptidase [Polyangiaceae bacterium]